MNTLSKSALLVAVPEAEALVGSFQACFAQTRRFPDVLYLAPEPAAAFRQLTHRVAERFPETPPYGGRFAEVIPHLTIAHGSDPQHLDQITDAFEQAASDHLPISTQVSEVTLMENTGGYWRVRHHFRLGTDANAS